MLEIDRFALVSAMRRLSIVAGRAIMDGYVRDDMGVRSKEDASPVTEADEAADAIISAGLRADFPDIALVTEEQSKTHGLSVDTFLIVDPLDGTKEFVKRNGEFTVNIALIHNNRSILGVVYAPVLDKLYFGLEANGAFIESNGSVSKLSVNEFDLGDSGLNVVASRSHLNEATEEFLQKLSGPEIVSLGSSLKFRLVAEG